MFRRSSRSQPKRERAALPESMLDLIWILLFFFLMISTIRKEDPPVSVVVDTVPIVGDHAGAPDIREAAHLSVSARGEFRLGETRVTRENLANSLTKIVQGPTPPRTVILTVDRQARVEDMLAAEDAAREVGLQCLVWRQTRHTQSPPP